jgi:anaerobic magnesium-protoporphyrin IX monomethyl ester cyclase
MKVLLIQPAATDKGFIHLGLAFIAATLEQQGHAVKILDIAIEGESPKRISSIMRESAPDIVGIATLTPTYFGVQRLAAMVKELFPRCPVVVGGTHVSALTEEVMKEPNIDFAIKGEGELSMAELVKAIEEGKGFSGIKGVSYKQDGSIVHNAPRPLIENLDTLPSPPWHLFRLQEYMGNLNGKKAVGLSAARGCPFGCVFCYRGPAAGENVRMWSPQRVVQEIKTVKEKYGIQGIHFWNDVFTYDKRWVDALCNLFQQEQLNIEWDCQTRADLINEPVLRKMKAAGCKAIMLGVESGSNEVLQAIDKKLTKDQIRQSFELLQQIGFETTATFTLGLPWDTRETIKETIAFAREINPDFAMFYMATPFPGSPMWSMLEAKGARLSRNWANYRILPFEVDLENIAPVFDESKLSREELKGFLRTAQIQFQLGRMRGGRRNLTKGIRNIIEIFKLVYRRSGSASKLGKLILRILGDLGFAVKRRIRSLLQLDSPAMLDKKGKAEGR